MTRAMGQHRWTRRRLLAALGGAAALPLSSCTGGRAARDRLRVAFPVSGTTESLDPHTSSLFVDQARAKALFDTLVGYADDMTEIPRLAHSWEPDRTGRRWRIRLRRAHFHDRRRVTAEDVLYSYRRIADPATASPARPLFTEVDFTASRARSDTELELVLARPNFEFPSAWGAPATEIIPAGTREIRTPIGSGPFRFVSFEPGGPALFARFDGHWAGAPRSSRLEFVPINDESARVNALLSGQVHYAHDISANSARLVRRDARCRVLAAPHGMMQAVALKVDRPPFSDPRVVQAIRLGTDRAELVKIALGGQGEPGNDLFGKGLEYYPGDLTPIGRDVDLARRLLRESGTEGLTFALHTSAADPYFETAASVLAEQLREIGVRARPRVGSAETYFSDIQRTGVAAHVRTATLPVTTFLGQRLLSDVGTDNYTRYHSPEFDALFRRAMATADRTERARLLADAQRLARTESGMLVWGFSNWNEAASTELSGLRAAPPNSLDWARFDRVSAG